VAIGTALAQSYPSKPIKLILPFAPLAEDMVGHTIGQKRARKWPAPWWRTTASAGGTSGLTLPAIAGGRPPSSLLADDRISPLLYASLQRFAQGFRARRAPRVDRNVVVHPRASEDAEGIHALARSRPRELRLGRRQLQSRPTA
jgi:hypothetical protein